MKNNIVTYILSLFFVTGSFYSCSLEEYNPTTVSLEDAYRSLEGYEGLINACYVDLYFFYGKVDFIGPTEAGTDSWINAKDTELGLLLYDERLAPGDAGNGTLNIVWKGLYSMINVCNSAIYYADYVEGITEERKNQKVAEAYLLRAFANFNLVEQFGGVTLQTESPAVQGTINNPKRNTEEEFYDLILSDLEFACKYLPLTQAEPGRVSRKAAYALMAKACLQRTRLGDESIYAQKALDAANELINNQSVYGCTLYTSDDEVSGFTKLWDGNNNKNNTEFLFLQGIDHDNGYNPDGWNRGRTRQYYITDLSSIGGRWGTIGESSVLYSRANTRYFKPTRYLLTECFVPEEDPADTRFAETFWYKYYSGSDITIDESMIEDFNKDNSLLNYSIKSTLAQSTLDINYWVRWLEGLVNMEDEIGLAIFTPNWNIPAQEKAYMPMMVSDPTDMFDEKGVWTTNPFFKDIYPSLRKFSAPMWAYDRQYWMGNIPIIRLGEVYLIAAEASILLGNPSSAVQYINPLRERAAITSRQSEMVVSASDMTIDFILKERARELTGEHMRWYDLKRTGRLNAAYLNSTNPEIVSFDDSKHTVRPIPQDFLDSITNADEYGNNGY